MEKEILRLFKGYYEECDNDIVSEGISEKALKYGLIIGLPCSDKVIDAAIEMYGKDGEKWNQTFHKDFEIVKNAPIGDLIIQQLLHYYTTYGFESLGIYKQDTVYVPREKLEIPELKEDIELIVIKMLQKKDLEEKLMTLLTSGIALSEQTVKDIMVLSDFINKDRFDEIKNREIKTALYDKYNVVPNNPDEFLRYLLFKTTGETLKIQNKETYKNIEYGNKEIALNMLKSYINRPYGMEKLSSIFLRNKNLFLAFKIKKSDRNKKEMNAIINKLRKLAVYNHKAINTENNILDHLTDGKIDFNLNSLDSLLDNVSIFREIRILNGILYRINGVDSIVYKIRNGKSYVNKLKDEGHNRKTQLSFIANTIKKHLINRLSEKVKGKTIYIPSNVVYSAPTSEKQFNGNFPEGSYLEIPRESNMVYGVNWKNIISSNGSKSNDMGIFYGSYGIEYKVEYSENEERVDLDLKQMNKNEMFGWDASYRNDEGNILFSGDMTDAHLPKGASELFYIDNNYGHGAFLVTLNMYTNNSQDVPFEFVIAKTTNKPDTRVNYVLDPNNILEKINMTIKNTQKQIVIGFIVISDTIRFYFNDFSAGMGNKRYYHIGYSTSVQDDITMGAFEYLQAYNKIQLKLNDLLKEAGAQIVDKPAIVNTESEVDIPVDVDLSPNAITKESLIKLLS